MAKKKSTTTRKKKGAPRKRVPAHEEVIIRRCRRQCCLCFGLRTVTEVKDGQIVHLDRDRTNTTPGNLAYLCLECHKNYDKDSNRVRGYTPSEVLYYRDLLYRHLGNERVQWDIQITAAQDDCNRIRAAVQDAHQILLKSTFDVMLTERPIT